MANNIMYRFHARPPGYITCRFWLLNPHGCHDIFCKYAHAMTGAVSPPSSFACYAYNNGGCRLSQDQCLFAHLFTDPQSQYMRIRHPELALRDVPIAEAAAKAGFDCGSWPKLRNLIVTVRKAGTPSYPDRWSGSATWSSPGHLDRYRAEQQRARRGVNQAYKDADMARRAASVPAFVVPAKQLIENMRVESRIPSALTPPSAGKRNLESFVEFIQDARKRLKIEEPLYSRASNPAQSSRYINLAQGVHAEAGPQKDKTTRSALEDISNGISQSNTGRKYAKIQYKHDRDQRYKYIHPVQEKRANEKMEQTTAIMARIASRLHATAADIDTDRDVLRQRWEVDDDLKDEDVTNNLWELNVCFTRVEEAISDGITVIEERLLPHR